MRAKAMISTEFCSSDAFLELSLESQLLYIHLNLQADGIGAVDSVKRIMRGCGISQPAFDELVEAGLLAFLKNSDDAAWFIVDFWVHNNHDKCNFSPGRHFELANEFFAEVEGCRGRYQFLEKQQTETSLETDESKSLKEGKGRERNESEKKLIESESNPNEEKLTEGGLGETVYPQAPCPNCGQVCLVADEGMYRHLYCPDCGDYVDYGQGFEPIN